MRARHETHHKLTRSLTQSPQLQPPDDIKVPRERPQPLPFHTPQKRPKYWKKALGCFLSQEQTEPKEVPGGFTRIGLRLEEWGGFSEEQEGSVFPLSVGSPNRHHPPETN